MDTDDSIPYHKPFYTVDGEVRAIRSVLRKGRSSPRRGKPRMILTESGASGVRFLASLGLGKTEIASVLGTNHHTLGSADNRERFDRAYSDGATACKDAVSQLATLPGGGTDTE